MEYNNNKEIEKILKHEFKSTDSGLEIIVKEATADKVLNDDCKTKAILLLNLMPNGIQSMSMELLNQFMNDAVDFTFTAIVLALTLFALAAIWKWLIGVSIRFVHWLCPGLVRKKKNNSSDSKI